MSRTCLKSLGIVGLALLAMSCSSGESDSHFPMPQATPSLSPQATDRLPSSSRTPTPNSPIRAVDFDNITYPDFPDYSGSKRRRISLKPGEGGPNFINYGDITGDGIEEAMVALGIDNRGSAITYCVYTFTIERGRPKLIWDFETGDRADGGLRQVYADNGQLVIELFGKDRVIGGQLYQGDEGLCCPNSFTEARYKWTGKRFELVSKEIRLNPRGDANVLMPLYDRKSQVGGAR